MSLTHITDNGTNTIGQAILLAMVDYSKGSIMQYHFDNWVEANSDSSGYWVSQICDTLHNAVKLSMETGNEWRIRPTSYGDRPNPENTTWMIAIVGNERIGASELWLRYDAIAKPIIIEREIASHNATRLDRWKGFCTAHCADCALDSDGCFVVFVAWTHLETGERGTDSIRCNTFEQVKLALGY